MLGDSLSAERRNRLDGSGSRATEQPPVAAARERDGADQGGPRAAAGGAREAAVIRLLAGAFVAVLLIVAALLVVPGFLDWTQYRETVAARLGDVLGIPVRIDGTLEIAVLPAPVMTAYDVVVDRPAGAAAPSDAISDPLLDVDIIEVQLDLSALLTGAIEVERAVLMNPRATVVSDADGVGWIGQGLFEATDDPGRFQLDRLTIENGEVLWHDRVRGVDRHVAEIFAQSTAEGLTGPAGIVGSASVGDVAYTVDLSTGRLSSGGALPIRLALGVDGVAGELRFAGLVRPADAAVQGEVAIAGVDPIGLWARFTRPPGDDGALATIDAGAAGRALGLEAGIEARPGFLSIDASALDIAGSRGRGTIVWDGDRAAGQPRLDIDLTFNRVLADDWVDGFGLPALAAGWLAGAGPPIPAGLTAALDIDLAAATLRGGVLRNLRLIAAVDGPQVAVERLSGELPGGSEIVLRGTATADRAAPSVDAQAVAASADLRGLLAWGGIDVSAVPPTRLRSLSGQLRLSGRPDDWRLIIDDIAVDSSRLSGGLAWRDDGERPGLGLRLTGDHVDLDGYHIEGVAGLLPDRLFQPSLAGRLLPLASAIDANIEIDVGPLSLLGRSADRLSIDATLDSGGLILRRAALVGLDGLDAAVEGRIGGLAPVDDLALQMTVDAERASVLTALLRPEAPTDAPTGRAGATEPAAPVSAGAEARADPWSDAMALIRLAGDRPFAFEGRVDGDRERLIAALSGTIAGGRFDLGGAVDTPWEAPRYDLAVRTVFEDGDQARAAIAPDYRPREELGLIDAYAQIVGPPSALALEDLRVSLGPLAVAGRIGIDRSGPRPHLDLDLRTGSIPVLDFLPAGRVRLTPAATVGRWSSEPLDLSPLGAVDADLRLTAGGVRLGDLEIGDVAGRATLSDGVLDVTGFDGHVLGGRLGLAGRVVAGELPEIEADITLIDADLAAALERLLGLDGMDGTLALGIDVRGQGRSAAELARGLDGHGLVTVRDGVMADLDLVRIERALGELEEPIDFLAELTAALESGRTEIRALNAEFDVVGGIAHTEALTIVTPTGRAEGRGLVDLADRRLDISSDFALFGAPDAPPFVLQVLGPLSSPVRRSQTQALQAYFGRRAAEALADRFGDLIVEDTEPAGGPAAHDAASQPPSSAEEAPDG